MIDTNETESYIRLTRHCFVARGIEATLHKIIGINFFLSDKSKDFYKRYSDAMSIYVDGQCKLNL